MHTNIAFFEGLTQTEGLERLLSFSLIKKAFIDTVLPQEDYTSFKVENHYDQCLTLSNDKYLIFLMINVTDFILEEIHLAVDQIDDLIPVVVQLEDKADISVFKNHKSLTVAQITSEAIKDGVPENNLFLVFLRELFETSGIYEN